MKCLSNFWPLNFRRKHETAQTHSRGVCVCAECRQSRLVAAVFVAAQKLAITFLAHTSDWAALDWVPCQLASASPREKSAPQWQENVRHKKKASVGIYGNLWESMGSLEKTSQCYGNPLLRTTEIPNIRYCVPLKSLISVTAYH